jgi:hypothetical protein
MKSRLCLPRGPEPGGPRLCTDEEAAGMGIGWSGGGGGGVPGKQGSEAESVHDFKRFKFREENPPGVVAHFGNPIRQAEARGW